ncbi:MAG TPA: KUP/HAK/KT family potassium transporter [Xanthobacteraceae bacterium]
MSSVAGDAEQVRPRNSQTFKPILILTALGIVYGDIGTSPLYVFQAIAQTQGGRLDAASALGSLSLIVWTLIIIVTIKYSFVVMRADNHGEGGILALMSLTRVRWRGRNRYLIVCGLIGAALLYGDGMITPAISVLSAVEGLKLASHAFAPYTMPIAAIVLVLLFVVQRFGTAAVGKAFGPLMLLWFVSIAVLGLIGVVRAPRVLVAIDPRYGAEFLFHNGITSLAILGGVFLCVTGAEAMYADMGHLGRAPIRFAWTAIVLPALLLNYAGQTALALQHPVAGEGLLFRLAPSWMLYPLVVLATLATIIASQAIITGSFSLTRQAMQLGWLPGMRIDQTSSEQYGQIYVPFVNWLTMAGTVLLTVIFARSDRLAGAYGAAVSTTMLMTTAILYRVMLVIWRWRTAVALAVFSVFLAVDIAFFVANLTKIADGGWIPLVIGGVIFTVMTTWHAGMDAMHRIHDRDAEGVAEFLRKLREHKIGRSPGKAIYLTRLRDFIPPLIEGHVRQMASLPEEAIALTVGFAARPRVRPGGHVRGEKLGEGFWHLNVRFGFMEVPDLPRVLHQEKSRCPADLDNATYFSERDYVTGRKRKPRMAAWRRRLFAFLYRNAIHPADRFNLPPQNFVQISRQIEV